MEIGTVCSASVVVVVWLYVHVISPHPYGEQIAFTELLFSGGAHVGNKSEGSQSVDGVRELQTPTGQDHYSAKPGGSNLRPLPGNAP
jgi:hypothetical protein